VRAPYCPAARDRARNAALACAPLSSVLNVLRRRRSLRFLPPTLACATFASDDLRKTLAPFLRIAGGVKDGVHHRSRFCPLEKDGIGKTAYQGAAIRLIDNRIYRGLAADACHASINRTQELLAEPRSATLVPDVSFGKIDFSLWSNNQLNGHIGRASVASRPPRTIPKRGLSEDSLFYAPVPVFASRGPAQPLACRQGHPTDLPPVEVSQKGLDQRSKVLFAPFDAPRSILSKLLPGRAGIEGVTQRSLALL
jgi:hypothetical protein